MQLTWAGAGPGVCSATQWECCPRALWQGSLHGTFRCRRWQRLPWKREPDLETSRCALATGSFCFSSDVGTVGSLGSPWVGTSVSPSCDVPSTKESSSHQGRGVEGKGSGGAHHWHPLTKQGPGRGRESRKKDTSMVKGMRSCDCSQAGENILVAEAGLSSRARDHIGQK